MNCILSRKDVSLDLLPCRFPFGQPLAGALKTNISVTSIKLDDNSIGDEGVKAFCVPGFQVAARGVFVASLLKGFVVCSCSSFAFPVSNFCWLSVKWMNWFLTWTHSVWYDVVCFLLGYWHDIGWKCISVSKTFASNPVGIVVWKLGVGNWELCLLCISQGLTDVSLDLLSLLPHRFPFCQALAEALKTNTSVTSIDLGRTSSGVEGVKAFCVVGFQVAAHGVFVASFLKGFVVCSCSSFAFNLQVSNLIDCQWSGRTYFWIELLLCGLMWYAFYWDIGMICGWKCTSVNHICLETNGICSLETRSRKLRVVSHLYFMTSHRCQPWSTSKSLSLWPGTGWSFEDEHFRDKHQPVWQFHRRWGSEGL